MRSRQSKKWLWLGIVIILLAVVAFVLWYITSQKPKPPVTTPPTADSLPSSEEYGENPDWLAYTTVRSFGWPSTQKSYQIREYTQFTVGFDAKKQQPAWVAYELLPTETEGTVGRRPGFRRDPNVQASVSPDVYTHTGYDRGHMAPAADFSFSREAMEETFFTTNICPQLPDFNRGIWRELEEQTRRWSLEKGRIWVVTGPVFGSSFDQLGESQVAIPSGFYKALFAPDAEPPQMLAFYFPHTEDYKSLDRYAISTDAAEEACECNLFYTLPNQIEEELETYLDTSKWF